MPTHSEAWKALAGRIRALGEAAQLDARYRSGSSANDTFSRTRLLHAQAKRILVALEDFLTRFDATLPPAAKNCIRQFIDEQGVLIRVDQNTGDMRRDAAIAAMVFLAAFETELTFLLLDGQEPIRVKSERALAHLQRSIVADGDVRAKWQAAFNAGEPACEALGAAHLLLHGIWAFKANAAGERTDLVFKDEPVSPDAERYSDGLVLTEWKRYSSGKPEQAFDAARQQAKLYASGALGGNELTAYRYAIVVSLKHLKPPPDLQDASVTYRHINIAVDPASPSKTTRGTV